MKHVGSFGFLGLAGLVLAVLVAALRPGGDARIAYACTGGNSYLEWYTNQDAYDIVGVALVEVVEVGGPENTTPPITPTPSPEGFPPITATPITFDLTGIGATLRVIDDLSGGSPTEFRVDLRSRELTEQHIRQQEANPWMVAPCPIGFLVPHYEQGARYVVVAGTEGGDSRAITLLKFDVVDEMVVLGKSKDDYGWQIPVTRATYDKYFSGLALDSWGSDEAGRETVLVTAESIPLEQFLTAVRDIFTGAFLPPVPTPPPAPSELPSLEDLACQPTLLSASGGDVIVYGNLAVALPPAGHYVYGQLVMDPGGIALRICHLETKSIITISDVTGEEISRSGTDPFGLETLDQIIASLRPASHVGTISPPTVGDAGLK